MITTQNMDGPNRVVGSEIEAQCKKCGQDRMSVITEMKDNITPKRVRCLTCSHEQIFRGSEVVKQQLKDERAAQRKRESEEKKARKAKLAKAGGRGEIGDFKNLIGTRRIDMPRLYSRTESYAKDEIIEHPSFGIGIVAAVRGTNKIDVAFMNTGAHTLIHNCLLPTKI